MRLENRKVPFLKAFNMISAHVSLASNLSSGKMRSDVQDLMILKALRIKCNPASIPLIEQVTWHRPLCYWVKCNSDGAARGTPGLAACGGIQRP